ncbi:MAG: SapC family protein [Methanobacterium sp.]|nr:SapC family protein [Methanobacterium sp.]
MGWWIMVDYVVVAPEICGGKSWSKPANYLFAAKMPVAPVLVAEVAAAAAAMPLAFSPQGSDFGLVAVLGLSADHNLYVAPDGRWMAGYIPAVVRGYPFRIGNGDDGQRLLCIDAAMVSERRTGAGEPFFDDEGRMTAETHAAAEGLSRQSSNMDQTASVCALLQERGLIVPWDVVVQSDAGNRKIEGLFRIDEQALNNLSDEQFVALRKNGGLLLAYSQLLSMHHLATLGQLAQLSLAARSQRQAVRQATMSGDIDLSSLTGRHRG